MLFRQNQEMIKKMKVYLPEFSIYSQCLSSYMFLEGKLYPLFVFLTRQTKLSFFQAIEFHER